VRVETFGASAQSNDLNTLFSFASNSLFGMEYTEKEEKVILEIMPADFSLISPKKCLKIESKKK
jgi:hypothetical protein